MWSVLCVNAGKYGPEKAEYFLTADNIYKVTASLIAIYIFKYIKELIRRKT